MPHWEVALREETASLTVQGMTAPQQHAGWRSEDTGEPGELGSN